jgi:hypothetical protein
MENNFQRTGSVSNAHAGNDFENRALNYFKKKGIELSKPYTIKIGIKNKKNHRFDLGNSSLLVECKTMTWTESGNMPSAKILNWSAAMYYFYLAPKKYKKIFFVERDYSEKYGVTLLEYYIDKYYHLIPQDVDLYDYDTKSNWCQIYTHEDVLRRITG